MPVVEILTTDGETFSARSANVSGPLKAWAKLKGRILIKTR